jgi:hypothetical protein
MTMMLVWYCQRCRKALRVQPRYAMAKGCRCKVPTLPSFPTKVWT